MGIGNTVECSEVTTHHSRFQNSFLLNPKSILNANCSQEESETIIHLYALPHVTLSGQAKWGLGIVTGNNKKFIRSTPLNGYVAVYKGSDIKNHGINDPSSYIPDNLSLYQQVAPIELYQASEKLIYKFISSQLVFFHDKKQRYVLNSANMLIPESGFPISQVQLCQLLNSKVVNWLFKTVFDTHKVLRADIESIPIHFEYFNENPNFEEHTFNNYLKVKELEDGTFQIEK